MEYPCRGSCSEGGHLLALSWLHDQSLRKAAIFAISCVCITKQTFYIAFELDTDILKIAQQLIWICFVVRRL